MLKQFSKFVVGDGRGIRFWKDTWCGTEPLSETFHNICLMVDTKDAYLIYLGMVHGKGGMKSNFSAVF